MIMNTLFPTTLNLTLMQQRRAGGTTQSTAQPSVSYLKNYDNVVGVLCCYKARPGPWWNNPMLDNLLVTPRYSSDFHKNRLWVGELKMLAERSCECYGRNISWDAAASCLPALLPPSSHLTEPQSWPDSAAANPAICVELTGKGLYCQG